MNAIKDVKGQMKGILYAILKLVQNIARISQLHSCPNILHWGATLK